MLFAGVDELFEAAGTCHKRECTPGLCCSLNSLSPYCPRRCNHSRHKLFKMWAKLRGAAAGRVEYVNQNNRLTQNFGGRGGIRTHGGVAPTAVFKTAALNHSATLPWRPESGDRTRFRDRNLSMAARGSASTCDVRIGASCSNRPGMGRGARIRRAAGARADRGSRGRGAGRSAPSG